jgi:hypothetical protein
MSWPSVSSFTDHRGKRLRLPPVACDRKKRNYRRKPAQAGEKPDLFRIGRRSIGDAQDVGLSIIDDAGVERAFGQRGGEAGESAAGDSEAAEG